MFSDGLYSLMTSDTGGLMSVLADHPMSVLLQQQTLFPCLTYRTAAGHDEFTFENKQWQERLVQFDAWSNTSVRDCLTVMVKLRNLINGYQGTLTDGTRVLCCLRENVIDNWDFDGRTWRVTNDYRFTIVEAA
jgi:hypothetical protein